MNCIIGGAEIVIFSHLLPQFLNKCICRCLSLTHVLIKQNILYRCIAMKNLFDCLEGHGG